MEEFVDWMVSLREPTHEFSAEIAG